MSDEEAAGPADLPEGLSDPTHPDAKTMEERLKNVYQQYLIMPTADAAWRAKAENLAMHYRAEFKTDGIPVTKETVLSAAAGVANMVTLFVSPMLIGALSPIAMEILGNTLIYYSIIYHGLELAEQEEALGGLPAWPS